MSDFKAADISDSGTVSADTWSDDGDDKNNKLLTDKNILELFDFDSDNSYFDKI